MDLKMEVGRVQSSSRRPIWRPVFWPKIQSRGHDARLCGQPHGSNFASMTYEFTATCSNIAAMLSKFDEFISESFGGIWFSRKPPME